MKWGLFFVLLHNVFIDLYIYSEIFEFNGKAVHYYTLREFFLKILSVITMHGTERLLGGFWFLKALFYGSLLFYIIRKILSNVYKGAMLLLAACFVTSYFHLSVPYLKIGSLDFFAAFFIMTGHAFKTTGIENQTLAERLISHRWLMSLFALIVGMGAILWPTSMLRYQWNQIVPYAITAIMGTIVLFSIGNWINHWNLSVRSCYGFSIAALAAKFRGFFIYIGGYTFNVLTWHFLSFKLVSLIIIAIYGLNLERLGDFPAMADYAHKGWWIAYLLIGVVVPIFGTYLYHKIIDSK